MQHNTALDLSGAATAQAPAPLALQQLQEENRSVKPLRILVAEDDPCDAMLLEQALFKAAVHVPMHFVDDGQEAIEYLRGDPPFGNRALYPLPTLLLLNLDMPELSGFDVLHWLRRQSEWAEMLTVLFGTSSKTADIQNAFALGADAYLVKPADAGDFLDAAKWLKRYWINCTLHLQPHASPAPVPARQPARRLHLEPTTQ